MLIPGYDPFRDSAGYWFNEKLAQSKVDFFRLCLTHVKAVEGRPAFVLEPWQQAIVGNLLGWVSEDTGLRRYRESLLMIGRKNGKTPLAAGLILCLLATDKEPGAEIYGGASSEDQAERIWEYAEPMVRSDDELSRRFHIYDTLRSIVYPAENSSYKVISGSPKGKHGYNAHVIVLDELHEQPDRKLLDALITSMSARRQPLILYLTTSDFDRPSVCNEKADYAAKVRDGVVKDPAFMPVIYEVSKADLEADPECWKQEKTWYKANPNLGVSKNLAYMRRECLRAQNEPSYLNTFLRLELNIKTQQDTRWIDPTLWAACRGEVDPDALRGRPCYAGLDLASTTDLIALVLYFPEDEHRVLSYAWLPAETIKRRTERGQHDYALWEKSGDLRTTEGNVADYDVIRADIVALSLIYDIQHLAYDPWNARQLANQLAGDGLHLIEHRQGFASMNAPSKELERLVTSGQLQHGDSPVLTWCASNVQIREDPAGNIKPDKGKSAEKIDAIVALIMAIGGFLVEPAEPESVYNTRGVLSI